MTACLEKSCTSTGIFVDLGAPAGLDRLEGARADEREPRLALPADLGDHGVAERGPLADELAVLELEVDQVPVEACVEPRGEARGDVRREDGCAEEDGVETLGPTSFASTSTRGCGSGASRAGSSATKTRDGAVTPDGLREPVDARPEQDGGDIVPELRCLCRARRGSL